jgi:hypothetical protein
MLQAWNGFYELLGAASGGLIGLVFIVVTLTSGLGLDRARALRGASQYLTPTVLQFAVVLVVSAVSLAPLGDSLQRAVLALVALAAMVFTLADTLRVHIGVSVRAIHWSDPWCYAIVPAIGYALFGALALAGWAIGSGAVALLILMWGIRNAWDLITWLAPGRPGDGSTPPPG